MTLTAVEAEDIVANCIRSAVGWEGLISGGNKLSEVGVVDDEAVDALIDEIVTNAVVGVPSKGHEIDPESLDLTTSTSVSRTQVQVIEKATVAASAVQAALNKVRGVSASAEGAAPAKSPVAGAKRTNGERSRASESREQGAKKQATKKGAAAKNERKRAVGAKSAKKTARGGAKRGAKRGGGRKRR
jgi:hypothetical protein